MSILVDGIGLITPLDVVFTISVISRSILLLLMDMSSTSLRLNCTAKNGALNSNSCRDNVVCTFTLYNKCVCGVMN